MKILIFTEGTALKPSSEKTHEAHEFRAYVPNGKVVQKLQHWKDQGEDINYLTSRTTRDEIDDIRFVLKKYNFPQIENLLFRNKGQEYKDVAEALIPDVFIEDDCASIGGEVEMTYPHITPEIQAQIHSIIVPEFANIDYLPENTQELAKF
ncbi:hypothetical protein COY15_03390 [Candidatus Roizmanbacteria bacterium CG_4_10_14_0_2_um_filter_39_12]|nr:MAG: hypothetical protein COY15_03390 [Candidatus Roizmanbacteria bacterium CG_4_10_14_0_2_um_filter_39_12]